MSKGDIISGISNIGRATYWVFQPAAGVEAIILQFGSSVWRPGVAPRASPRITAYIYDGTNSSHTILGEGNDRWTTNPRLGITNTIYMQMYAWEAGVLCYSGIQTKGTKLKVNGKIITGEELEAHKESWATTRKEELEQNTKVENDSIITKRDGLGNVVGMEWSEHD